MIDTGILKQQYTRKLNVCINGITVVIDFNMIFFIPPNKAKYSFTFLTILRYNNNKNNFYYNKNNCIVFKTVQFFLTSLIIFYT